MARSDGSLGRRPTDGMQALDDGQTWCAQGVACGGRGRLGWRMAMTGRQRAFMECLRCQTLDYFAVGATLIFDQRCSAESGQKRLLADNLLGSIRGDGHSYLPGFKACTVGNPSRLLCWKKRNCRHRSRPFTAVSASPVHPKQLLLCGTWCFGICTGWVSVLCIYRAGFARMTPGSNE